MRLVRLVQAIVGSGRGRAIWALAASSLAATPVAAQVAGGVSVESDLRLRGYSMSAGRPAASARIGVDDPSGFYVDGSATAVLTQSEDVRFLGYQVDSGFAHRLGDLWTLDVGLAHNDFRPAYTGAYPYSYTEGYAGLTHGPLSAYVFVSPNYFHSDNWTLYGQLEATVSPLTDWRLTAHVGTLHYLASDSAYRQPRDAYFDWRLGLARQLGPLELHAAVSGGSGRQYYYGESHSRTALTAGGAVSF